jgi:hypothetical protein
VWLGAAARSCNNTIYPSISLSIYTSVHSISSTSSTRFDLNSEDVSVSISTPIHSPVRQAFHLSYPLSRTRPHRTRPIYNLSQAPLLYIDNHIHQQSDRSTIYQRSRDISVRQSKQWETVSPTLHQKVKEKVKS